jgi:polar amino acid transport system permease protein
LSLFSIHYFLEYLTSERYFWGAAMTLLISICALAGGIIIGLCIALMQELHWRATNIISVLYLWIFRGTPLLLQLIFVFNVLPVFGIVLSGFTCAVLALSLNEGAYMAEIMRSGIRAVDAGQRQAARALGMREWQVMRWVVLPQATRIIIPPTGNQFIAMLKMSALVSVIAVQEILLVANQAASSNFRYLEALSAAAVYYLFLTSVFMIGQAILERKIRSRNRGGLRLKDLRSVERLLGVGTPAEQAR